MNKLYVSKSEIHGVGVFTVSDLPRGEVIPIPCIIDKDVTKFGSLINHSWYSNVELIQTDNTYYLITTQNIDAGDELLANYQHTPDFIAKPEKQW